MPNIPRYEPSVSSDLRPGTAPQRLDIPDVSLGELSMGAEALGAVGKSMSELSKVAEHFYEADQLQKLSDAKFNVLRDMEGFVGSLPGRKDYANFIPDLDKLSTEAGTKYGGELKGTKVRNAFNNYVKESRLRFGLHTTTESWQRQKDEGRASVTDKITSIMAMMPSSGDRASLVKEANDILTENTSYLSEEEEHKLIRQVAYEKVRNDVWSMAQSMGYVEGVKYLMDEGNVPELDKDDRNQMVAEMRRDHALEMEAIRSEREAAITAEQERLLQLYAAGRLRTGDVMSSALDPFGGGSKQTFLAMLDSQTGDKGADPYRTTTNPKLYIDMIKAIDRGEEQDLGKIMDLAGPGGLSVTDAMHLRQEASQVKSDQEQYASRLLANHIDAGERLIRQGNMFSGYTKQGDYAALQFTNVLRNTVMEESDPKKRIEMLTDTGPNSIFRRTVEPFVAQSLDIDAAIKAFTSQDTASVFQVPGTDEVPIPQEVLGHYVSQGQEGTDVKFSDGYWYGLRDGQVVRLERWQ